MTKRLLIIVIAGLLALLALLFLFKGSRDKNIGCASPQNPVAVKPGIRVIIMDAEIDKTILASSHLSAERISRVPQKAAIGIYYPACYKDGMAMPVFFAMSPGTGDGISAINSYYRIAEKLGFVVAAVQVDAAHDIEEARYYYMLHAIEFFKKQKVLANQPVWIGGMSGGAKWALHMGAWGGKIFSGIIAICCNEDFASLGYRQIKNSSALDVPIVLINGTSDKIAGIEDRNYFPMIWTMKQTGFKTIKISVFDGGHVLPHPETIDALNWLLQYYKSHIKE